jgi:hypothetical protein
MKKILLCLLIPFIQGCSSPEEELLNKAITAHGSSILKKAKVSFDFRAHHYVFQLEDGLFDYQRSQSDSLGNVTLDVLTNEGFERKVNGNIVAVPDSMSAKYSSSINSVAYFLLLPKTLQAPAVILEKLNDIEVKTQKYEVLKVSFKQEGGGKDFQDEFRYWVNTKTGLIDYLAYNYQTDGGGIRFREAYNVRKVKGVIISDYRNYGFENLDYSLDDLPKLFAENKIPLLSSIENKNIEIEL